MAGVASWGALLCVFATASAQDWVATAPSDAATTPPDQTQESSVEVLLLQVRSDIQHRYATTVVHTKLANLGDKASEVRFTLVLPDRAFISNFLIKQNDNVYKAYVKEKVEAEKEYNEAVEGGQTAAHIGASARDSDVFTVSVNAEPKSNVSFNLTYEELLSRRLSLYSHVLTLTPNQVVRDLRVDVHIKETSNITKLIVTALGQQHDASKFDMRQENEGTKNSSLQIRQPSAQSARVHFTPSKEQQLALLGRTSTDDLRHQILVQYDVDRSEHPAGEVMFTDGYFVHFFAPKDISPLPKHVIFVLDYSGSMWGQKSIQLQDAMVSILDSLREQDYFSIIQFNTDVTEWTPQTQDLVGITEYSTTHEAKKINIDKAKHFLKSMNVSGGTNINGALRKALQVAAKHRNSVSKTSTPENVPQPIVLFLTDGIPTIGELRNSRILAYTRAINTEIQAAIFSLAFGDSANFYFLKKLSLQNNGFARRIYEGADASLQLESFFQEIASPLLSNVTFSYVGARLKNASITKQHFHSYYGGSEIVVAGELEDEDADDLQSEVTGWHELDYHEFHSSKNKSLKEEWNKKQKREGPSVLERVWAYLTIKQLLNEQLAQESGDKNVTQGASNHNKSQTAKALKLAVKYGFVTPLTSLIVVKPANTSNSLEMASMPQTQQLEPEEAIPFQNRIISLSPNPGVNLKPSPQSPSETKLSLADLSWLADHLDASGQLTVASDNNASYIVKETEVMEIFQGMNEFESCITPNGTTGSCYPLSKCVLKEFVDSYPLFLKYFCPVRDMAGVCCPQTVSSSSSILPQHQEKYFLN